MAVSSALICRSRTSAIGEAVCGAAMGEATHNAPNNTKALFMARTIAQNARSVLGAGTSGIVLSIGPRFTVHRSVGGSSAALTLELFRGCSCPARIQRQAPTASSGCLQKSMIMCGYESPIITDPDG